MLFYITWYGWDRRFNGFYNTFSIIMYTKVIFIKSFLKENSEQLSFNLCVQIFTMAIFLPAMIVYLAFGYYFFEKNKKEAATAHVDKNGYIIP